MGLIHEFCSARGIRIIDDAAHAFGTTYRGRQVGAGDYSDMSVFSFHAVKNLTTCEGGMVVTQSDELADRLRRFRTHGIEYAEDALQFEKPWVRGITSNKNLASITVYPMFKVRWA